MLVVAQPKLPQAFFTDSFTNISPSKLKRNFGSRLYRWRRRIILIVIGGLKMVWFQVLEDQGAP